MTESSAMLSQKKSVRFSDITVREYPMILGDNPAVSCGPPVTIDWQYSSEECLSIDEYIETHPLIPRIRLQMIMPEFLRETIVVNSGCQYSSMIEILDEIDVIKAQRVRTIKSLQSILRYEMKQNIIKKMKNTISRSRKKRAFSSFSISVKPQLKPHLCALGA